MFKSHRIKKKLKAHLDWIRYAVCLITHSPYFGPVMSSSLTGRHRKPYMEKLVQLEILKLKGNCFNILEIGSWAGSSTIVWADAIKKFNSGNGSVTCVDPWKLYIHVGVNVAISTGSRRMRRALKKEKIHNLFLHNISASKHDDIVRSYKASSNDALPTFREKQFDLIFVDGDHSYSQTLKDLRNCERLLCDGGVLCGDDLELQKHEIDIKNAEVKKERDDCILDTKTNKHFHPGVTLAVGEFCGSKEVSNYSGFWVMRKTASGWQRVELD